MLKIVDILKKTSKILIKLSNYLEVLAFLEPWKQNKVRKKYIVTTTTTKAIFTHNQIFLKNYKDYNNHMFKD